MPDDSRIEAFKASVLTVTSSPPLNTHDPAHTWRMKNLTFSFDDVSRMLVKDTLELLDHLKKKIENQAWRYLADFRKELKTLQ